MAGTEFVKPADRMRTIKAMKAAAPSHLDLHWSDGTQACIDIAHLLNGRHFDTLQDAGEFARAYVGEWGHHIEWPGGAELAADTLWLETLSAMGRSDTRAFLEWRMHKGLSLSKAADALGISRRMVAYYSNGEKPVPRPILLACKGWDAERAA